MACKLKPALSVILKTLETKLLVKLPISHFEHYNELSLLPPLQKSRLICCTHEFY